MSGETQHQHQERFEEQHLCDAAGPGRAGVIVPRGAWLERVVESTRIGRATDLWVRAVADTLAAMIGEREEHVRAARVHRPRIGTAHFTTTLLTNS